MPYNGEGYEKIFKPDKEADALAYADKADDLAGVFKWEKTGEYIVALGPEQVGRAKRNADIAIVQLFPGKVEEQIRKIIRKEIKGIIKEIIKKKKNASKK